MYSNNSKKETMNLVCGDKGGFEEAKGGIIK